MKAPYECDLHSHTVGSDGNDTPYELIENALARGMKVLAVTDHDVLPPAVVTLPDGSEEEICSYAAREGLCLLRGIEYSCETTVQDVHIVGLGCDWTGPIMAREVNEIALSKARAYEETVRRLNERGYSMDLEELLTMGGTRIDLTELQKKRIFDMMALKGYTPDWKSAKLLVREDPYLSVEREKPAGADIIRAIHQSGGIAILAHPWLIDETVQHDGVEKTRWEYIRGLIDAGLDGIEIRYTYDKTSCKDKRPREVIWEEVRSLAEGKLFFSGGSDYHADGKKGTKNPREIGECGLTFEEFLSVPALRRLYEQTMDSARQNTSLAV